MKNQALFSLKDKSKQLKCRLLQFLFGAIRVNTRAKKLSNMSDFADDNKTFYHLCVVENML